jgi:hypothetical protein
MKLDEYQYWCPTIVYIYLSPNAYTAILLYYRQADTNAEAPIYYPENNDILCAFAYECIVYGYGKISSAASGYPLIHRGWDVEACDIQFILAALE